MATTSQIEAEKLTAHTAKFDGALLERGFWLYVWTISDDRQRRVRYVGRTGDSSSPHASSPFRRIGQHLGLGDNAKANSLARRLEVAGMDPKRCIFEMFAVGPLFKEQKGDMAKHRPLRDRMAALEIAVANHVRKKVGDDNFIGKHASRQLLAVVDAERLKRVCALIDEKLGDEKEAR
jgi:hypothetical protein